MADDLAIDEARMGYWSEADARAYFESGGSTVPSEKSATTSGGGGGGGGGGGRKRRVPAAKVPFHGRLQGGALIGVLVQVGGEAGTAVGEAVNPADAATQLMGTLSAMLPQLRWRVVQMVGGLEQPLLSDEEEAIVPTAALEPRRGRGHVAGTTP